MIEMNLMMIICEDIVGLEHWFLSEMKFINAMMLFNVDTLYINFYF